MRIRTSRAPYPGAIQMSFRSRISRFGAFAFVMTGSLASGFAQDAYTVGVGKAAPKLITSTWLRGAPIGDFQKGQVYVIESWATWCKPCVESMPHLTQIQKEFGDKVKVVGVDIWESSQALAGPFLQKMGDKVGYSIAQDLVPEGKTSRDGRFASDWIVAAGKYSFGVPLAFVVNGDGVVAWIGHPNDLEKPLREVVDGTWDLAAAKASYDASMVEALKTEKYKVAYYYASMDSRWDDAAANCDKVLEIDPTPNANYASNEFRTLYNDAKNPTKAMAFAKNVIESRFTKNAPVLCAIVRSITATKPAPNSPELDLAFKGAQEALSAAGSTDSESTSALAKVYLCKGDKAQALALQKKAVEYAKEQPDKDYMQQILDSMGN